MATTTTIPSSDAFAEFQAELQEVMRFKWVESERLGQDIGFEKALKQWVATERPDWRRKRREPKAKA